MDDSKAGKGAHANHQAGRLDSWKEIADYLRRSVRTVQRWEHEEHLPIHRHAHSDRDSVYAFKQELDNWLRKTGDRGSGFGIREIAQDDTSAGVNNLAQSRRPWEAGLRYGLWLALLVGAAAAAQYFTEPPPAPHVIGYTQLTNHARAKGGDLVTDGVRLYFSERLAFGKAIVQVPVSGGEAQTLSTFFQSPRTLDLNRARAEILVLDPSNTPGGQAALWSLPIAGAQPRRLGEVFATEAAWSPEGKGLAYAAGSDVYVGKDDGSETHKIGRVPGIAETIHWSPDGRRLRLTLAAPGSSNRRIWELRADGSYVGEVFADWAVTDTLEGRGWTPDGQYFLLARGPRSAELWAAYDGPHHIWGRRRDTATRLTNGPLPVGQCAIDPIGKRLFYIGSQYHNQLLRFDTAHQGFVPYLVGVSADFADFSPDSQWLAYVGDPSEEALWRRRADGKQALQLTFPPMAVELPRWSPDGKQIAFLGRRSPKDRWQVYVIPAAGGKYQPVLPAEYLEGAPTWSPDGKQLAFGELRSGGVPALEEMRIHIVDLKTHKATTLPGSEGLYTARWSPNGQFMAALSGDSKSLFVFDFHKQRWQKVATAGSISDLNWTRDSAWIYFEDRIPPNGPAVFRVRWQGGRPQLVATLKGEPPIESSWIGLTPQGELLVSNAASHDEVYALEWKAP